MYHMAERMTPPVLILCHTTKNVNLSKLKTFVDDYVNMAQPFPKNSPGFYVSAVQVLKTLWEKEKLLIPSNFYFSYCVFYLFGEFSAIFIKFEIVVCKLFQFGRV